MGKASAKFHEKVGYLGHTFKDDLKKVRASKKFSTKDEMTSRRGITKSLNQNKCFQNQTKPSPSAHRSVS